MPRRFAAVWLIAGCAASPTPAGAPSPVPEGEASAAPATPAPAGEPAPASTAASAPPPAPSVSPEPPPGTKTLPAVSVRDVGLHVGGGPNDAAGKAQYLRAIAERFPDFLRCYPLISEPGQSGTFGVDLHIGKRGGKPRVEQPRTGLPGDDFKKCMVTVFESVSFPEQTKPTVVSYSLRFTLED